MEKMKRKKIVSGSKNIVKCVSFEKWNISVDFQHPKHWKEIKKGNLFLCFEKLTQFVFPV